MRNKIEKSPVRESLFKRVFGRLAKEEDGFAMEYVIIVLLVAAGVVAVVMVFSGQIKEMFSDATVVAGASKPEDVGKVQKGREKRVNEVEKQLQDAKTVNTTSTPTPAPVPQDQD